MHVALRDGETQEGLLARFTKGVQRSGILKEAREHRFFVPKPEKMRIAARKAARKAGGEARVHASLDALVADANVDAVDVCLPHHLHADAIVRAARAGKHVLCEKPLCLSFEEARTIKRAVDAAGVTLTCAHNNLFQL